MNRNVKFVTLSAILVAMSFLLTLLSFPLPLFPPWLKLDFAEIPALLGGLYCIAFAQKFGAAGKKNRALLYGIAMLVVIELLKNVLNILIKGASFGGVGELANFLMGLGFCLPVVIAYGLNPRIRSVIVGAVIGVALGTLLAVLTNVYLLIPAIGMEEEALRGIMTPLFTLVKYPEKASALWGYALLGVVPFNIIKMGLQGAVLVLVYRKLLPILTKG